MPQLGRLGVVALLLILGPSAISSDLCEISPPKGVQDVPIPNIFDIGLEMYQINVELNYENERETAYFKEYYNVFEENGRIDMLVEDKRTTFLYYNETKEQFSIEDGKCTNGFLSEIPDFMKYSPWNWADYEEGRIMYGPSAMLRSAYLSDKADAQSVIYYGPQSEQVRGMSVRRWRQCNEGNNVTIDYYFTDPDWEEPYGFKGSFPVRVRVSGYSKSEGPLLPQTYEFAPFEPLIEDLYLLEIPAGYGCGRMTPPEFLPNYRDKDIELLGEVVYRTITDEIDHWKYIQNVHIAYDDRSKHLAYTYTPWEKTDKNLDKEIDVKPSLREIYDMERGITYRITEEGGCTMPQEENATPKLQLPDGKWIEAINDLLFLGTRDFRQLGDAKLRGFDVIVHEKVSLGPIPNLVTDEDAETIVTRYYLKKEVSYSKGILEKNAPVQTQIKFVDKKNNVTHLLIFNMFAFSTILENKPALFDVRDCFPKEKDSVWFTAVFPGSAQELEKAVNSVPEIEQSIVSIILQNSEASPLRLPKVLVDFDDAHVYTTVRILGRPSYEVDFEAPQEDITLQNYNVSYSIISEDECAFRCLEMLDNCHAFSYCGATCYLTTMETPQTTAQSGCKYLQRHKKWTVPLPTIANLEKSIRALFIEGKLVIDVGGKKDEEPTFLTATDLTFEVEPPTGNIVDQDGYEVDSRLTTHQSGAMLKAGNMEEIKNLGQLPFPTCQQICLSKPSCQSLSYCIMDNKCLLSTKHGDEIVSTDMASNSQCEILTRKYSANFNKYPGLILSGASDKEVKVKDLESCARECVREKTFTCKSYEFCPEVTDGNNCQLRQTHFLDAKKPGKDSVVASKECVHYSRKYIMDFSALPHTREKGEGKSRLSKLTPEECAKECVENTGFTCVAFDFIPDDPKFPMKGTCFLSEKLNKNADLIAYESATRYSRDKPKEEDKDDKGRGQKEKNDLYTNSLAGGLGFLFFLIGGALGVAGLYYYAYYKVNKNIV